MRRVISLVSVASILALAACSEDPEPVSNPREWATIPDREGSARDQARDPAEGVAQAQAPRPSTAAAQPGEQRAPERYAVRLDTTKGPVIIDVTRAWAPHGADRFYTLVREGYFTDVAFFRVVSGFMAQTGIHGDPEMNTRWRSRRIPDDPVVESNTRGMVSYAMAGPGTRTTQFFINFVDNSRLNAMGFAPFGRVRDMAAVDALHAGYGEGPPSGRGPNQARIQTEGNAYLRAEFPQLDYIRSATIVD